MLLTLIRRELLDNLMTFRFAGSRPDYAAARRRKYRCAHQGLRATVGGLQQLLSKSIGRTCWKQKPTQR